jgi:hypothetical protein
MTRLPPVAVPRETAAPPMWTLDNLLDVQGGFGGMAVPQSGERRGSVTQWAHVVPPGECDEDVQFFERGRRGCDVPQEGVRRVWCDGEVVPSRWGTAVPPELGRGTSYGPIGVRPYPAVRRGGCDGYDEILRVRRRVRPYPGGDASHAGVRPHRLGRDGSSLPNIRWGRRDEICECNGFSSEILRGY